MGTCNLEGAVMQSPEKMSKHSTFSTWVCAQACGSGSKLNQGTAGCSPIFHLPGFHFGCLFLTHSHVAPRTAFRGQLGHWRDERRWLLHADGSMASSSAPSARFAPSGAGSHLGQLVEAQPEQQGGRNEAARTSCNGICFLSRSLCRCLD